MSRIAYVVSQYPAPSHTFIRREIAALRKRGLSIHPFSIRPGVPQADEQVPTILAQPWHRLLRLSVWASLSSPVSTFATWLLAQRHRPSGVRGWIVAQFHFIEALVLAAMLRQAAVDRIHSHFANSGATVAMLAARYLGIPWSLTLHGISETDAPSGTLLGGKIQRAEFVACASWFMRAQGMRTVPAELWSKFHIVRCGVELRKPVPSRTGASSTRLRFVTVGRISAEKGYAGLLQAFTTLLSRGIDAELAIIGDGPLRRSLESELSRLELNDRVTVHGALPEEATLELISTSDIFVLPSLMEGLPVVIMEAMALEKPVIAALVAGIPELVLDGSTGLLFRPGDWSDLARCMILLAADPELRRRLTRTSRRAVEQEYDIDHCVEQLAQLFASSTDLQCSDSLSSSQVSAT